METNKLVDLTLNPGLDCIPLKLRAHAHHFAVAKTLKGRDGKWQGSGERVFFPSVI